MAKELPVKASNAARPVLLPKVDRPEAAEAPDPDRPRDVKVKAVRNGFYDNVYRKPGDVFLINEGDFSEHWMEKAKEPKKPKDEPEGKKSKKE